MSEPTVKQIVDSLIHCENENCFDCYFEGIGAPECKHLLMGISAKMLAPKTGKLCPIGRYSGRNTPCMEDGCAAWGVIGWEPAEDSGAKPKEVMGCKLCGPVAMRIPFGGGVA